MSSITSEGLDSLKAGRMCVYRVKSCVLFSQNVRWFSASPSKVSIPWLLVRIGAWDLRCDVSWVKLSSSWLHEGV